MPDELKAQIAEKPEEITVNLGASAITGIKDALDNPPSGENANHVKADDTTLCIKYDVGLGSGSSEDENSEAENGILKITSETLKGLTKEKTSISIDVVLVLSLNFGVEEPISIDLMNLTGSSSSENSEEGTETQKTDEERDLLKRSKADAYDNYRDYLKLVKDCSLIIEDTALPMTGTFKIDVDMYGNNSSIGDDFGDGETTNITISPQDLLDPANYPLEPKVNLIIQPGKFGLKRDVKVGGKVKVKVKTDNNESIQVYPFNNQNDGGSN